MNETDYIIKVPILRGLEIVAQIMEIIGDEGYIGGSFAAWMTAPQVYWTPNDIDIFVKNGASVLGIASALMAFPDWKGTESNDIACTVSFRNTRTIQIVRPHPTWVNFPDDIIGSFDLDICRAIIVSADEAYADINAGGRTAKILNVQNPLRNLRRVAKYLGRGVEFNDHELLKLFRAWDNLGRDRQVAILEKAEAEAQPQSSPDYSFAWDDEEWFESE